MRAILGSVRLSAPALVCGGTLAYHFADGSRQPLCSFAGQDAGLFANLPSAAGVGIALQMQDGSTRVLRMSHALEQDPPAAGVDPLSAGQRSGYPPG